MISEREIALDIIMETDKGDASHSLIRDVLGKYDYLEPRQKAFIKKLAQGSLERRITLDYITDSFASVKTAKQKPLIRSLLRMSVYQIFYMDQVPDSAAINEAVNLAGKRGFKNLKGFVNGVLRNISRQKDKITFPAPSKKDKKSQITSLSVTYSMPEFICDLFLKNYGYDKTEDILKAFLNPRPVTIRMDERLSKEEMKRLADSMIEESGDNFAIKQHELLPYAYELTHTDNIQYLPGYEEGNWMVQDVSSMLVSEVAGLKKGDVVIDVCSAPGGKALHAAAKLVALEKNAEPCDEKPHVYSRDLTSFKTRIIEENVDRMGLSDIVTVEVYDALEHDEAFENKADVLYCDLPCSGLGIIGRKADIKYGASQKSLKSLSCLQQKILENVWNYVKPGGIMMYSTCTINPYENEKMVDYICENLPFERVDITMSVPSALRNEESLSKGYLQLLPGVYDTDGFFLAKLRRV
ncbi:16S rRNA (cytosine(967)-C(5))-methyltransferase RsmB [Butyrivibrio fibrisolvens]|uniref:16S rRNA (cytosine(967)-C(5))-methyltransferase RsmB n=1 Tax=Butyrivibrio fibrisolvens TaxID=831 RepID=UPI000415298D|nr:16S rRNA (cytosine(967)-C(5))-methyltransferase RsmB [Butyrivibrio fibrisolvens]